MVQHLCNIQWGYLLPSTVFTPKPKVSDIPFSFFHYSILLLLFFSYYSLHLTFFLTSLLLSFLSFSSSLPPFTPTTSLSHFSCSLLHYLILLSLLRKVDAVVLKLTPLVTPAINVEYLTLEKIVKCLFQYRRKYIRKGARFGTPV